MHYPYWHSTAVVFICVVICFQILNTKGCLITMTKMTAGEAATRTEIWPVQSSDLRGCAVEKNIL